VNKQPTVYILASRRNGTLYIGVTSDLGGSQLGGFAGRMVMENTVA
jgi:hypothetical protein